MPYEEEIFKSMGMETLPLKMPNIKNLMKNGVTFTNTISPSPLCAPARACLASGLRYHSCNVKGNHKNYPLHQKTYYSVLKEKGYSVGAVGKLDLHKPTLFWGLNGWLPELETLGFTHIIDNEGKWDAIRSVIMETDKNGKKKRIKPKNFKPKGPYMKHLQEKDLLASHVEDFLTRFGKKNMNTKPTPLPEEAYCDNWIIKNALKLLDDFPRDKPWHLVVNFAGPHDPWDVTKRMKDGVEDFSFPAPVKGSENHAIEENKVRQNYAAMLENIDRNIGIVINKIKDRGELDNTIILYSSDHGEMLGDFKRYGKTRPERPSVKIPLVISGPTIKKGFVNKSLVELQDLTATILDYAETEMHEARESETLRGILEGNEKFHRHFQVSALDLSELGINEWKMISNGKFKIVVENNQNYRLFDLEKDPWELHDLSENLPSIKKELLNELNLIYSKKQ